MKIKRIYIDRFGGLADFSLEFRDGFNLIFGNNEDGKTTVMSFLRLMFYGEVTKKADITLNLRRRFSPFSGERMGGEVEFTHGGKTYLLSKQFGKTPRSDRVSLIDCGSGTPVPVPAGKEVGELFFDLGAEAFERSIFIGSLPTDGDGSAEFSEKLRRLVYSDDGSSFEQIKDRLQKAQLKLHTPRGVGLTDKLTDEIKRLEHELEAAQKAEQLRADNCRSIEGYERELTLLYSTRDELKKAEEGLRSRQAASALSAEMTQRSRYAEYKKIIGGVTRETLRECEANMAKIAALRARLAVEREAAAPEKAEAFSDGELLAALDKLEDINRRIKEAIDSSEPQIGKSSTATVLFILAGLGVLGACILLALRPSIFWIALLPAAVLSMLGLSALRSRRTERESALLQRRQELLTLEEEKKSASEQYIILNERKKLMQSAADARREQEEKRESLCLQLENEISKLSVSVTQSLKLSDEQSYDIRITELKNAFARLEECEAVLKASPYSTLTDDELTKKLSELRTDEITLTAEQCAAQLKATEEGISRAISLAERTRAENENLMKTTRSVAVIENEIREKQLLRDSQEQYSRALTLASSVLEAANSDMRQNFAPELNRLTGELFSRLTDGRHNRVTVSEELELTVTQDGAVPFSAEQLSAGSFDQAQLCLRLALARLTGGENCLPLLLDDVLMQYDDTRTKQALSFLYDYAKENQVLLFTCHGYQKDLVGSDNVVFIKR